MVSAVISHATLLTFNTSIGKLSNRSGNIALATFTPFSNSLTSVVQTPSSGFPYMRLISTFPGTMACDRGGIITFFGCDDASTRPDRLAWHEMENFAVDYQDIFCEVPRHWVTPQPFNSEHRFSDIVRHYESRW